MKEISNKTFMEDIGGQGTWKKGLENQLYLNNKLFCLYYKPNMSMNDHMHASNRIRANLLNLDEIIEDDNKALLEFASWCIWKSYHHLTLW